MKKIFLLLSAISLIICLFISCVSTTPPPPPTYYAPTINSTPITTATVGVTYTYNVNATDPDGDILIYSLITNPTGMTINSTTGLINWTPTATGDYNITIEVFDDRSPLESTTQSFTIHVDPEPVNYPPTITSTPITSATVDMPYTYDVTAADPDGDILTYSLTTSPTGMTINSTTGLINWTPTATGDYDVTVGVFDNGSPVESTTQSFIVHVDPEPVNYPPTITSTPITTATVGVTYTYNVNATDPDGDILIYSLINNPIGMTINSTTGLINWTPTSTGDYTVTVEVFDNGSPVESTAQSFTITVNEECIPSLVSPSEGAVFDNGCSDHSDLIIWNFDWSDCPNVTRYHLYVIHSTATIPLIENSDISRSYYTREDYGYISNQNCFNWKCKVRAMINGQWGHWSEERTFNVEPLNTDCNHPPVISNLTANPSTIDINQTTTITCNASDPDGDSLTYAWTKTGGTFEGSTASSSITWRAPSNPGKYIVECEVSDGKEEDSDSVNISVGGDNYTITASTGSHGSISPSGDVIVNQGSDKTFTITPDTGYIINDVLIDGSSVGAVSSYTFTNVTEDHSIYVAFIIEENGTYSLRDIGPAGGYIFYDKGSYSDGWRYMEAAPVSTEWTGKQWSSQEILIGGTKTGIGTGQNNTNIIVAWLNSHSETDCAAQLCDALVYGGYSDWFLPSKDELNLMYENLRCFGVGFTPISSYFSSSESSRIAVWWQHFDEGYQHITNKYYHHQVRAVRICSDETYTLTTSVSPSGSGSVSPSGGTYTSDTSVTLTATPATDYKFDHWSGDASGSSTSVTITMNSNKNVTAYFVYDPDQVYYTLTTSVSPSGSGSVSPSGGTYTAGTSVTLTATPATDYKFDHWGGGATGTSTSTTITMNSNKNVTAYFVYDPDPVYYTLTTSVSPSGSGEVYLSPSGGTYTSGTSVTLTAAYAPDYKFDHWGGSVTGTSTSTTVTMNSNKNVTAYFIYDSTKCTLTTSVSPSGSGSVSPSGGTYDVGTTVTITAHANPGYEFDYWSGDIGGDYYTVTFDLFVSVNCVAHFKLETIQYMIDNASDGEVITLEAKTYYESGITFPSDRRIILQGVDLNNPSATVIDGKAEDSVFVLNNVPFGTIIRGLTIQNAKSNVFGGGVDVINGSPTISGNHIKENSNEFGGAGVGIIYNEYGSGNTIIEDNNIFNNSSYGGAGIDIWIGPGGSGVVNITNNTIFSNYVSGSIGGNGGAINASIGGGGNIFIEDNEIYDNIATDYGGGIFTTVSYATGNIYIENNSIYNNSARRGGGINNLYNSDDGSITINNNNTISNNSDTEGGGGIYNWTNGSGPGIIIGGSGVENTICGNKVNGVATETNQVYPNNYPDNFISAVCGGSDTRVISLSGDTTFGDVKVSESKNQTLTISNTGNSSLNVTGISYPYSVFSGNFVGSIAAGSSQLVDVTFDPSAVQTYSGTLTVNSNKTGGTNTRSISGTGISDPDTRIISLSGDMAFGSVNVSGDTDTRTLTISNTGNSSLNITGISYPYSVFSGNFVGSIAAGSSQLVDVTFDPSAVQTYSGTLTVNSNKTGGTNTRSISGTGISDPDTRIISLSGDLDFGNVDVGDSDTRTLRISNTGNSTLYVTGIDYPYGDSVYSGDWSGPIPAGSYHDVTVTFAPIAGQYYNGQLWVNSNKTSGTDNKPIYGRGIINEPVYRAVCIGISDYLGTENDLHSPLYDLDKMIDMLSHCRFGSSNIEFTTIQSLKDDEAKVERVCTEISGLFSDADSNDVSYIYFRGHGNFISPNKAEICLYDSDLSVDGLESLLKPINGTKVVILDSCHSGGFIGKGKNEITKDDLINFNESVIDVFSLNDSRDLLTKSKYVVLTCCHYYQQSWSIYDYNPWFGDPYSVFTTALVQGCGYDYYTYPYWADNNGDRDISLQEACTYTEYWLANEAPEEDLLQDAQMYPEGSDFPIVEY